MHVHVHVHVTHMCMFMCMHHTCKMYPDEIQIGPLDMFTIREKASTATTVPPPNPSMGHIDSAYRVVRGSRHSPLYRQSDVAHT